MTRIPAERRRRGIPWWIWLLIALAVAALIWLLFALLSDEWGENPAGGEGEAGNAPATTTAQQGEATTAAQEGGAEAPATTDQQAAAAGEPITDVLVIVTEPDRQVLVGRQVQFAGVNVQSVVGDRTFWVGPSQDQQLFVVLDEELDASGAEGRVDVNTGQTIAITGTIRRLPSVEEAQRQWGLSEATAAELENEEIFLSAERVQITGR